MYSGLGSLGHNLRVNLEYQIKEDLDFKGGGIKTPPLNVPARRAGQKSQRKSGNALEATRSSSAVKLAVPVDSVRHRNTYGDVSNL